MVEEGLRGGISMVSRRYAYANNLGMGEGKWNMNKPKSFLLYLDANNLYGWAMMQYLPTGNFRWIRDEQKLASLRDEIISNEMENDIPEDYILKVKLAYPRELHHSHTDYHLAIERMKGKDMYSRVRK
ncbi:hypothetical protein RhiirA1_485290 [Rhizophagus irregularis]|uniref:DNA-directed DNA polymerase n=1 Tax=Rhizophagus irregularis TaxID=588596 RepID=A0A2N0QID9_9GLOM|nr:hypothetical protein RhiirA1_485290 [Rhizophagus irregularis]